MKIFYAVGAGRANALLAHTEDVPVQLTPAERTVLCDVVLSLQRAPQSDPPQRLGKYVRIRVGVEDGKRFVEYAESEVPACEQAG